MAIELNQIVPWGRSRAEYEQMFQLRAADLAGGVLDCGGGPASFTAELCADGCRALSVDPIYAHSSAEIRARFEAIAEPMLRQVRATPDDWVWSYHRSPEDLLSVRRTVVARFLTDYDAAARARRYLIGELPRLPLVSGSFGLALCSHLLFLYSDLLNQAFHVQSVRELCRVAREVRVFPLITLSHAPSPHLVPVRNALHADGRNTEILRVPYELQRGGNQMLRIY